MIPKVSHMCTHTCAHMRTHTCARTHVHARMRNHHVANTLNPGAGFLKAQAGRLQLEADASGLDAVVEVSPLTDRCCSSPLA